jgi:hypothetical protein
MLAYCVSCVMPGTKPDLVLDDAGVCNACGAYERRLAAMRAAGCAGIVLGKSLLEQRIELGAALEFQDGTGAAPLHRPASAGRRESTC